VTLTRHLNSSATSSRTQAFRNQGVHLGEIVASVALALHAEGRVPSGSPQEGLEKALDRRCIDESHRDLVIELRGKRLCPLRQSVELCTKTLGKAGLDHLPLHLLPKPDDLPGHLAVLSMAVLRWDVSNDFNANGPIDGFLRHRGASAAKLTSLRPERKLSTLQHESPCRIWPEADLGLHRERQRIWATERHASKHEALVRLGASREQGTTRPTSSRTSPAFKDLSIVTCSCCQHERGSMPGLVPMQSVHQPAR